MSDLLKVKIGGSDYLCKWKPMPYKELEYIQFDRTVGGANFVIPVTSFSNEDKEIVFTVESDGIPDNLQDRCLQIGRNNDSSPGILINHAFWSSSSLTIYSRNNLADYYTPNLDFNSFTNKRQYYMKNGTFDIRWSDGTVFTGWTNYASTSGFNKIFLFTDRTTSGEYGQFWGKFYGLSITDVIDLRPAKRKSDGVLGLYDAISDSFIRADYGESNIIAGPAK
jgi:hypothetical protein